MYWLIGLFALEAILEAYVCGGGLSEYRRTHLFAQVITALALVTVTVGVCLIDWQVWIWGLPIVAYRLVNLLRVYRRRLPLEQLRTIATRAFGWLLVVQWGLTGSAWLISHFHRGNQAVAVLAALQLFAAAALLRTSMHTWRHATPAGDTPALSDRELPSLSVLVPARNETDQLEKCLHALVASNYPKLEILVLDDCSAVRRTPEIIRSFAHDGVRFIQGSVPDETRWLAKNWAYERLVREASGELLLFCGVDALFDAGSLRQLVEVLLDRKKDMLSVMPLRAQMPETDYSLLQVMRYYWEMCLPRRLFKRPPVLSTCWLIKSEALKHMGGMEAVSRSINPEAHFARQAVVTDAYSFIRSDERLGVYSNKPSSEQYGTSVRVRYPQLHRRLELVGLTAAFELVFLLGPLIGLLCVGLLPHTMAYAAVWIVSLLCLLVTYGVVGVGSHLADPWYGWLLMPVGFLIDIAILHVSLWKYEFSTVDWKGRNVCIPVMRIEPHLPQRPN
ncbi:MAG TPA: glycosyltransferase family 2 protein [Candidatus Saccharimonadales bacterium]|nr:glycosyltransferase family 2 protein [Candidatus Saccharimonadales bacterium]